MSAPLRPIKPESKPSRSNTSPARQRSGAARGARGAAARVHLESDQLEYSLVLIEAEQHRFLNELFDAFGCATLRAWVDARQCESGFDRVGCDGLVTALVECDGRTVAIAWSDFRVRAASYGRANARRFAAFLRHLRGRPEAIPLIYVVNSAGLSLMEGRTAFSDVFALWPELRRYAEERLVFTCAAGKCLGLAPILFGLGHYRVAVAGSTQLNLTGPEVIKLFFGEGLDFADRAAAERCLENHDLLHETVKSIGDALAHFRDLLAPPSGIGTAVWPKMDARTGSLLAAVFDGIPREVVPGWCPRVRLFVGARRGRPFGLFVNPLGRSNNMITVRTLQKYAAGLDLFRALGLPIVSLLDSPGIDPRFDETDAGLIRRILWVGGKIIDYPHGSLGVVAGRCFGGATTLALPKVFGGTRAIALRGAQFGVMHERIVDRVLRGSPRLLAQWHEVAASQRADFADLIEEGSLDAVIDPAALPGEVDRLLDYAASLLRPDTVSLRGRVRSRTSRRLVRGAQRRGEAP